MIDSLSELVVISASKQGIKIMKKFLLAALLTTLPHISSAQVEDGIYVIPELDAYSVILTNNNVVRGYLFSLRGFWSEIRERDGVAW